MFTNTPSDRVQLVGLGELLSPGSCLMCGSGNCEKGYVRIGVYVDFHGEAYFCHTCVIQIAEAIGCMIPEEVKHLQGQAELLAAENATLTTNLGDANERLRVFYDALAGISPDLPSILSGVADSSESEDRGTSFGVDEQVTGESGDSESKPAESVKSDKSSGTSGSTVQHTERVIPKL